MKLHRTDNSQLNHKVAPFAGAWIETDDHVRGNNNGYVAPFAGAWIETYESTNIGALTPVAPFAGAWIETSKIIKEFLDAFSRSLRGSVD